MVNEKEIQDGFEAYRRENYFVMSRVGILLYLFLSYIDSFMVLDYSYLYLLGVRCIFITPAIVFYILLKKEIVQNLDLCILSVFTSAAIGVSYIAYLGGGLASDYYFGLVIISFVQFTFIPMGLKKAVSLDLIFLLIYFPLNYFAFDLPELLLIKQLSNYLTFSIMKFFAVTRSRQLIINGFKNFSLEKELIHRERVQFLFGKLCHLLNNPLFIAVNMVRKIDASSLKSDDSERLQKTQAAQERMTKVLRRMQELYYDRDVDLAKYQEFFNDEDFKQ